MIEWVQIPVKFKIRSILVTIGAFCILGRALSRSSQQFKPSTDHIVYSCSPWAADVEPKDRSIGI